MTKLAKLLVLITLIAFVSPAIADDDDRDKDDDSSSVRIAPIRSKPGGQTYGRWAAEWFQWAFGIPFESNPTVDPTGELCDQRQVGDTWFLAGNRPINAVPAVRECTIPAGRALFIPILNRFFGAELILPPEERTEEFVREQARCDEPIVGFARIDDVVIRARRLNRFNTGPKGSQSPIFTVQMPPGNLFGLDESGAPELVLTPAAEHGFYLYVRPLPPGEHIIEWQVEGCSPGRSQDITYYLTVLSEEDD